MSNLTDALIAAKLMGGSGGSGGGSGLPEIGSNITTVFAEQSVAFSLSHDNVYGGDLSGFVPVLGETYIVTWDGVTYTLTAAESDGVVVLGNLGIYGGTDTGEPFIIGYGGEDPTGILTFDTSASHTIGITQGVQSPADGAVLIVKDGAWAAQEGYGYANNGVTTPIDPDLADYALVITITADANAQSGCVCDCTRKAYNEALRRGQTIVIHDTAYTQRQHEYLRVPMPDYSVKSASMYLYGLVPGTTRSGGTITGFRLSGSEFQFATGDNGPASPMTVRGVWRGIAIDFKLS